MAISHKDHDHPNTPAARAACRKAMGSVTGRLTEHAPAIQNLPGTPAAKLERELAGTAKLTVVPRTRGDGGVVKGLKATAPRAAAGNLKRPGTRLRNVSDLPDVPRMLAYGARLAWANEWEVRVGEPFNDTEARIVVIAPMCEIALVWKVSLPDGVWGIFVRNWNSSVTSRVSSVQEAFEVAAAEEAWDDAGNLIGL